MRNKANKMMMNTKLYKKNNILKRASRDTPVNPKSFTYLYDQAINTQLLGIYV